MVEACIGLAVPGRPIRPRLVADACGAPILCDQTAGTQPGRAGAANHPGSAVSSGQPWTTTPQVNPPVRWQRDRLDLAYNDAVGLPAKSWSAGRILPGSARFCGRGAPYRASSAGPAELGKSQET
jgi:hypothetical protein